MVSEEVMAQLHFTDEELLEFEKPPFHKARLLNGRPGSWWMEVQLWCKHMPLFNELKVSLIFF